MIPNYISYKCFHVPTSNLGWINTKWWFMKVSSWLQGWTWVQHFILGWKDWPSSHSPTRRIHKCTQFLLLLLSPASCFNLITGYVRKPHRHIYACLFTFWWLVFTSLSVIGIIHQSCTIVSSPPTRALIYQHSMHNELLGGNTFVFCCYFTFFTMANLLKFKQ